MLRCCPVSLIVPRSRISSRVLSTVATRMHSIAAAAKPDASSESGPKQLAYIPNLKLSDGNEIPMLAYGIGTARSKKGNKTDLDEDIVKHVVMAIKVGFVHFDSAESYGNEAELGAAIKRAGVPRERLFITAKTSATAGVPVEEALSATLAKLGTDYVDLYLIHSPFKMTAGDAGAGAAELKRRWAEMEAVRASGRARSIGVSNYLREHLEPTLEAAGEFPPVINQIEFHPYLQHRPGEEGGDDDLLAYLRAHGIAASAYAPLAAITRAAPGPVDGLYTRLAEKYGVTEAEVALRWTLDRGVVAITTSGDEHRLQGYLAKLPAFKLTPREVEQISEAGLEKHWRGFWSRNYAQDDRR